MARKEKKYHYIYKTTNVVNGKFYIGMHSTDKLDDDYIGSGKRLWNSINYHGRDYHVKEILEFCKDRKGLSDREREIVNEQLLTEGLCMNLIVGGQGGDGGFKDEAHMKKCTKAGGDAHAEKMKNDEEYRTKIFDNLAIARKKAFSLDRQGGKGISKGVGNIHSEETKKKMSESSKGQGSGESNSQYGKCWITNGEENMKIFKGDNILEGWRLGRNVRKKT